jgi:rare lipoprotein A
MRRSRTSVCLTLLLSLAIAAGAATPALAREASSHAPDSRAGAAAAARQAVDRSGKKRVGTASVYSHRLVGRKMADGTRMSAHDDNAASRTLPLGTKAKVTNLETKQSATVTIRDRGPYAKGRIVDLSPATARAIGIAPKKGVAKVEVKPLGIPPERDPKN